MVFHECLPSSRDHPRGCGEHWLPQRRSRWRGGSSPRMRGARQVGVLLVELHRIIPTEAGNKPQEEAV